MTVSCLTNITLHAFMFITEIIVMIGHHFGVWEAGILILRCQTPSHEILGSNIAQTCLFNEYPGKPHFYIVYPYLFFLFFLSKT